MRDTRFGWFGDMVFGRFEDRWFDIKHSKLAGFEGPVQIVRFVDKLTNRYIHNIPHIIQTIVCQTSNLAREYRMNIISGIYTNNTYKTYAGYKGYRDIRFDMVV